MNESNSYTQQTKARGKSLVATCKFRYIKFAEILAAPRTKAELKGCHAFTSFVSENSDNSLHTKVASQALDCSFAVMSAP